MMKHLVAVIAVLCVGVQCLSAHAKNKNLKNFSLEQLKACYGHTNICGAHDNFEISDELTKRLPQFSTDQLVACFKDWKVCGVENDIETGWPVSKEVTRRGNLHELLVQYWKDPNIDLRDGIIHAAYRVKSPEVAEFMKRVLSAGEGDQDALYWPADYLGRKCDADGLKWLSQREGRPEGCILWAPTVALFGKCRYRPAIPYLIRNSLHDACLNIDDAAADDLGKLYPGSPKGFESPEMAQDYFCKRATQEGFKIDCTDN